MLEIPSLEFLRLQAQQDVETEVNGALGSRLRTALAYALAGIGYAFLKTLQYLSRQFFLDTADDEWALLWASIYGVTPTPATQSDGKVRVTGLDGTNFAGGEILRRDDGFEFIVLGAQGPIGSITSGELDVDVLAVNAGADGNTATGATLTFTPAVANVDAATIVLTPGLVDGFDAETAQATGDRALAQIRAPRRGGSEEDYEVWSLAVPGVAQAFASAEPFGIGTVLVIIAQPWDPTQPISATNTPIPTASLIADVEAALAVLKPAGLHGVFVQPPVLQSLDPYIVLEPDTPEIRAAVTERLALALADVEPGGTAFYDDLVLAIDRAADEEHHRLFTASGLDFGPYDTPVDELSLMIPDTITWTEPP